MRFSYKKYCYYCGNILNPNENWYCVNDKIYCCQYESSIAELYLEKKSKQNKPTQNEIKIVIDNSNIDNTIIDNKNIIVRFIKNIINFIKEGLIVSID